jgi:pimeloyl-ACP methyl ester carboxylesterase
MLVADMGISEGADREIAASDGLKLVARDYAPAPPVTGLPVICLHGLTRNARDFELVAPRIAALGRRVVALNVRGRGASARDPDPSHYNPATYAQDVLAMMDALSIPRAIFLGTSMGGIISMAVAAAAAPRVAGAILNDVGPVLETAGYSRIAGYVGKTTEFPDVAAALEGVKQVAGGAYPDRDDAFWATFLRRVARVGPEGRVSLDYDPAIAAAFAGATTPADMTNLFEALGGAPVLVVRGALSDLLSREGVDLMRLVKPDLDAVEAPGVGHAPTLEEEAPWLAIVDFLAKAP